MNGAHPALTIVVPAFRSAAMLRECLAGIVASGYPRERYQLIVVDDCSGDDTPQVARGVADEVLSTVNGPRGAGEARNVGAVRAQAPLLVFIDCDVVIGRETLSGFVRCFAEHPEYSAVFGAYDTAPAHPGFVSQYRNLLHAYVHETHAGEASTFWAGCGAVRRDAFLAVGGFDNQRFPRPQIEDVDLGYRLRANGHRILLAPQLTSKHLKQWTLRSMLRTDLRGRAIPWMHLLLDYRLLERDGPLNLAWSEKLFTVLTPVAAASLVLSLWWRNWLWLAVALLAIIVAGNMQLLAWFTRQRGWLFALGVIPLRLMFYIVSAVGAAWAMITHRFLPVRAPLPALRASTNGAVVQ